MNIDEFSKYEKARILGARALQIAMNAPLLIKIDQEDLEKIKFDALKIAEIELNSNILPISIKKPLPAKTEEALKRPKQAKIDDAKLAEMEAEEEKEIAEDSEIMGIVNNEEESDENTASEEK